MERKRQRVWDAQAHRRHCRDPADAGRKDRAGPLEMQLPRGCRRHHPCVHTRHRSHPRYRPQSLCHGLWPFFMLTSASCQSMEVDGTSCGISVSALGPFGSPVDQALQTSSSRAEQPPCGRSFPCGRDAAVGCSDDLGQHRRSSWGWSRPATRRP